MAGEQEENMQLRITCVNVITSVLRFVLVLTHHPLWALKLLTPVESPLSMLAFPGHLCSIWLGCLCLNILSIAQLCSSDLLLRSQPGRKRHCIFLSSFPRVFETQMALCKRKATTEIFFGFFSFFFQDMVVPEMWEDVTDRLPFRQKGRVYVGGLQGMISFYG